VRQHRDRCEGPGKESPCHENYPVHAVEVLGQLREPSLGKYDSRVGGRLAQTV
jgi:hypothetical protein